MEYKEYPKCKYGADGAFCTVADRGEEDALEGEWFDNPDLTNRPERDPRKLPGGTAKRTTPFREYPKMMDDGVTIVADEAAERAYRGASEDEPEPVIVEDIVDDTVPPKTPKKGKAKADGDDLL